MSRRNTKVPRDILYQEDSFGFLGDESEYLAAKVSKRQKMQRRTENQQKKKGQMQDRVFEPPDFEGLPIKKKLRGRVPNYDSEYKL